MPPFLHWLLKRVILISRVHPDVSELRTLLPHCQRSVATLGVIKSSGKSKHNQQLTINGAGHQHTALFSASRPTNVHAASSTTADVATNIHYRVKKNVEDHGAAKYTSIRAQPTTLPRPSVFEQRASRRTAQTSQTADSC